MARKYEKSKATADDIAYVKSVAMNTPYYVVQDEVGVYITNVYPGTNKLLTVYRRGRRIDYKYTVDK